MVSFEKLWKNHVGRDFVCDQGTFENQCAMRMGQALENSGVRLTGFGLKRCTEYSRKFRDHKPGHIRSAQALADVFYRQPTLLGTDVKRHILKGCMNDNLAVLLKKRGLIFIMDGWGTTDHIDVWDGVAQKLRGSFDTVAYMAVGKQVWFWEM